MKKKLHNIISNLKEGKNDYKELYIICKDMIYKIAYSIVKNHEDSSDIQQNVMIKIMELEKDQLPSHNEVSWLYTVVKNETLNYLKKKKQNINIEELYEISLEENKFKDIEFVESYNKIFKKLSNCEKEIVSLKVFADFTFREISEILNMPIGTIQWKYYRAIGILRNSIDLSVLGVISFIMGISSIKCEIVNDYTENTLSDINKNWHYEYKPTILSMILFIISTVCVINSIIYYKILKKHQQKLKIKLSNKKRKK